jgi:hypothetical protein
VETLWPWLAVAGAGALHGLNPATGWFFAAAQGLRARDRRQALRALLPIAAGHAASVALVAAAAVLGMSMDRTTLWTLAGAVLALALALALAALARFAILAASATLVTPIAPQATRAPRAPRAPRGQAALALWSCAMSTVHGAGLMLVPALIPICLSAGPARQITASGSLLLGLAAVGIHTVAMLAATAIIASITCSKFAQSLLCGARRVYGIVQLPSHLWLRKHDYLQDPRITLVDDRPDHARRSHQLPDAQHAGRVGADAAH